MTPDVNVLVAASRTDHPHHAVASDWLVGALDSSRTGATLMLMPMVLASFLRLVTSPKVFQMATPIEHAVEFVDALLASPGVQLAPLGPEWSKLRQLCLDKNVGGNHLPDARLSAAVADLGEHLVSFDRDFRGRLGRRQFTLLAPALRHWEESGGMGMSASQHPVGAVGRRSWVETRPPLPCEFCSYT